MSPEVLDISSIIISNLGYLNNNYLRKCFKNFTDYMFPQHKQMYKFVYEYVFSNCTLNL